MKLSGILYDDFQKALLDAYPTHAQLKDVVRSGLSVSLEEIAGGGQLSDVVSNLIIWVESQDRVAELIAAAHKKAPKNEKVLAVEREFQDWILRRDPPNGKDTGKSASIIRGPGVLPSVTKPDELVVEILSNNEVRAQLKLCDSGELIAVSGRMPDGDLLRDINTDYATILRNREEGASEEEESALKRLGRNLYKAIFPDKVGGLFEKALFALSKDGSIPNRWLRVVINVAPDSKAFSLPMELLYYEAEGGGKWLAKERKGPILALSRRMTLGFGSDLPRQQSPLHVLVVSQPQGEEERRVVKGHLFKAMADISPRMDVQVLGPVEGGHGLGDHIHFNDETAQCEEIRRLTAGDWKPHVLHFILGQARTTGDSGEIALVKANDKLDWVSASDICDLFNDWEPKQCPRVIVLQACENAVSGTEVALVRLADDLHHNYHISAVVAMQLSITNDQAAYFASGFYRELQNGKDIDEAVQSGRNEIYYRSSGRGKKSGVGAPVVFIHCPTGVIETESSTLPIEEPVAINLLNSLSESARNRVIYSPVLESTIDEILRSNKNALAYAKMGNQLWKAQMYDKAAVNYQVAKEMFKSESSSQSMKSTIETEQPNTAHKPFTNQSLSQTDPNTGVQNKEMQLREPKSPSARQVQNANTNP